jgi:hypothetical protein
MYKVASDKRQTALRRGRLADWVNGEEPHVETRTIHDKWNDLKAAIRTLEAHLTKIPKGQEYSRERRELGQNLSALRADLTPLGKAVKAEKLQRREIAPYFLQIAREQLMPGQFKAMYAAALRLKELDVRRTEKVIAEAEQAVGDPDKRTAEAERLAAEAEKIAAESTRVQKRAGDPGSSGASK